MAQDILQKLRDRGREIAPLAATIRELCGDDDLAFVDTLEGETDAVRAASQAVRMVAAMETLAEAAKALSARYTARSSDFENRAKRARDALAHFMGEIGEKTLTLPEATITLAVGSPSLTGDADAATLPDDLVRTSRIADRAKIKAALTEGQEIPGYALSNARPKLQIRAR